MNEHDDHRYQLLWKADADEVRIRRRLIASAIDVAAARPGWVARLLRWIGKGVGAQ